MKEVSLDVQPRQAGAKGLARRSRMVGQIPAIMYGPETEPMPVAIEERAFRRALKDAHGLNAIFTINVNGKQNKTIIRDVQRHPVTSDILHIDFHAISMTKPLHIKIPIHYVGISKGVKTDGGIMQTVMRDIEISCLPTSIPEFVEIDVTELGIGDSIHVRDLNVPNTTLLADPGQTVVVVVAPTVIKVEAPTAAEGEAAAAAAAAPGAPAAPGAAPAPAAGGDKKPEKK